MIACSHTVDYCNKELCKRYTKDRGHYYEKHIACQNNGDFTSQCPKERSVVPMTTEMMNLILQTHNEARSNIANGKISPYKPADQMIEMVRKYLKKI